MLVDDGTVRCDTHGSRPAFAACVICAVPLCKDCVRISNGRALCDDHQQVIVEQDWALVYSSFEINDAELAKSVLEEAGFKVVTRDFLPIGYVWDGAGDSAFSRSALRKPAKIFVPVQEFVNASEVLDEWSGGGEAS